MNAILEQLRQGVVGYIPRLAAACLVLIIGWWVVRILHHLFEKSLGNRIRDESLRRYMMSAGAIVLKVLLLFMVASAAGVETTSFLTLLGAAGLAIGLALQGSLANIAGGVLILMFKPFRVGEFIETQATQGTVTDIQMFHTVLRTADNKMIVLPNGPLAGGTIINHTREPLRRVDCSVIIPHSKNALAFIEKMERILMMQPHVLSTPPSSLTMSKITEAGTTVDMRVWTQTSHTEQVASTIYRNAYTVLSQPDNQQEIIQQHD